MSILIDSFLSTIVLREIIESYIDKLCNWIYDNIKIYYEK